MADLKSLGPIPGGPSDPDALPAMIVKNAVDLANGLLGREPAAKDPACMGLKMIDSRGTIRGLMLVFTHAGQAKAVIDFMRRSGILEGAEEHGSPP